VLTESSTIDPQRHFRAEVCEAWEREAMRASAMGVRTVVARFGTVLSPKGGALRQIENVVRWFPFLNYIEPEKPLPWISEVDAVAMILWSIDNLDVSGPLNIVAPQTMTFADFARLIAARRKRPLFGRVPPSLVRLLLGQFSEALLHTADIRPAKSLELGFWRDRPSLDETPIECLSPSKVA
jgi:NAD dependent epimerase/dehydratase family enzyme